jgi:alkylation response protein AidB-like acyl-CoA dehydrogenase
MDFTEHDSLAEYRQAARDWADEHLRPEWVELEHATGTHHNPELHALMGRQGLLGAGWPGEYGGTDVDPDFALAVVQEIGARGMRLDGWITTEMVARTILHAATEETRREIVPAALRGEVVIVLGYTEPGSGSDVAAASMRAVRDGDEWVINGSKMFTSTAHVGTHVFLLTRTNTEVPKHKGLTLFLARLDAPGVEIQPVHTLGGQRTNATFYSDVRVPDSMRIGDVDGGWGVRSAGWHRPAACPVSRARWPSCSPARPSSAAPRRWRTWWGSARCSATTPARCTAPSRRPSARPR